MTACDNVFPDGATFITNNFLKPFILVFKSEGPLNYTEFNSTQYDRMLKRLHESNIEDKESTNKVCEVVQISCWALANIFAEAD